MGHRREGCSGMAVDQLSTLWMPLGIQTPSPPSISNHEQKGSLSSIRSTRSVLRFPNISLRAELLALSTEREIRQLVGWRWRNHRLE